MTAAQRPRVGRQVAGHFETIAESAARLGVSIKTLRRRIADGTLTAYRLGPSAIRLDPAEVDSLLRPIPTVGTIAAAAAAKPTKDYAAGYAAALLDVERALRSLREEGRQ